MMNVKANMCSCCQEVWNQTNLIEVSLGKHSLYLCPDCFKELEKMIDSRSMAKMTEDKLKPCPFCGSHAQLNEYYGRESTHFIARCVSCEAQIYGKDKRITIEAWNRRADDGRE